jgi:TetR/AcrR family transcriptional regulator, fatty acid metabolism regulator protein
MSIHSDTETIAVNRLDTRPEKFHAILKAAAQVFARSGYFNARVSEVARAAGVADGTVYLYFRNKHDLLRSIFSTSMTNFLRQARTQLESIDDPCERLRRFARLHFEALEGNRDMAIVFQVELRQSSKFMEEFSITQLADYFLIIREAVEEGQRRGMIRNQLSSKLVAKFLFGALDEMATNWVLSHNQYSLAAMTEPVMDLFFHGVCNTDGVS